MSGLKRDQYVRPARPVIRFSRGGSYQDPPEVSIEITGTPRAMEAWARKIEAVDELIDAIRSAVNNLDELEWDPGDHLSANAVADALRAALALLDPPTTTVDGAATGAGPE